jgi:arginine exporter protein ArgO
MRYILGIFLINITFIAVTKVLVQAPETSVSVFTVEWFGLIFLSFIGTLLMYRGTRPIRKMNKLQEKKGVQSTLMHVYS